MRSTATQSPQFSKSAPNLDKSRMATAASSAANTSLIDINKAESLSDVDQSAIYPHHKSTLGKSEEVLSWLTPKSKRRGFRGGKPRVEGNKGGNVRSGFDNHNDDDDENDEEEVSVSGCFPFIRGDDSTSRSIHQGEPRSRKKFSFDSSYQLMSSPINNNNNNISNPDHNARSTAGRSKPNIDEVIYDRAFYRENQKSLDNVFAKYDEQQQSLANSNNKRNSRSSTVLTFNDYDEEYSSKFNRSCFLTANQSLDDFSQSYNDTFPSTDLSSQTDDSIYLDDHFKRSLVINSSTDSRKNSVTFRSDVESMHNSARDDLMGKDLLIDTDYNPASIYTTSKKPLSNGAHHSASSSSSLKSALRQYPPVNTSPHQQSSSSSSASLKKKNYLQNRLSRLFKRKSKDRSATSHSNSFYMKLDRFSGTGELNEQLLASVTSADEHELHHSPHQNQQSSPAGHRQPMMPLNGTSGDQSDISVDSSFGSGEDGQTSTAHLPTDEEDEPQYDAIFKTTHFLLARQND